MEPPNNGLAIEFDNAAKLVLSPGELDSEMAGRIKK